MRILGFVLQLFGQKKARVAAIIGDSASVNRALERVFGSVFVDCLNYRFNLKTNEILDGDFRIADKVPALKNKLSCNIPATLF